MENAEEIHQFLEEFSKRKPKTIPQELNDYLAYVARTGDPVYQWSLVKCLFKEKLLNVITDFYETTQSIEIPPYPNVDPFNYDIMKNSLLERLDSFSAAPFTVQRLCELLTCPRKQYNRIDKFMRAIEKNILVVSTREPGSQRHVEPENGEPMEPIVNGADNSSECNVDVEMEDVSWKENSLQKQSEPQPSSSDTQITVDDIEARLQVKENTPMDTQDKNQDQDNMKYESVTPPEPNTISNEDAKSEENLAVDIEKVEDKSKLADDMEASDEPKADVEMKTDASVKDPLSIPEIKVDDAEMTEQRLIMETTSQETSETIESPSTETELVVHSTDNKSEEVPQSIDDNSSDSNIKEELESKIHNEVSTSSEESSSSENTDGNSNSPKPEIETTFDNQEESNQFDKSDSSSEPEIKEPKDEPSEIIKPKEETEIKSEEYSISDLKSELPQPPAEPVKTEPVKTEPVKSEPEEPQTEETMATEETKNEEKKYEDKDNVLETTKEKVDVLETTKEKVDVLETTKEKVNVLETTNEEVESTETEICELNKESSEN